MPHTARPLHQTTSPPSGQRDRLSVDPESLFVYGSLLFAEVLRALLDRVPNRVPASAPGWRVASLPGRVYPGLARGPDAASGLLMTDLTPTEWRILDAFEDELYELRPLTLSDGRIGWAYVCGEDPAASPGGWDAGLFSERDLPAYVGACVAWRRRYQAS
jgi:gamma-glutamylcyclotransferase (GGCT)/AIG2-like uncharacterized protein YtfP